MNATHGPHDFVDDIAVYALGALPAVDAARLRDHLASCDACAMEYAEFRSAATAVGWSAETTGDALTCPSTLLKPRIMAHVRAGARPRATVRSTSAPKLGATTWPAYLLAAACIAIAAFSWTSTVALQGRLAQAQIALAAQRRAFAAMLEPDMKRYVRSNGTVIVHGGRAYLAMHDLPQPEGGKVYQAWTLPKGSKTMVPSSTFVPDAHGIAIVALPRRPHSMAAVAVSVEPAGGSRQPTSKPIFLVPLT